MLFDVVEIVDLMYIGGCGDFNECGKYCELGGVSLVGDNRWLQIWSICRYGGLCSVW